LRFSFKQQHLNRVCDGANHLIQRNTLSQETLDQTSQLVKEWLADSPPRPHVTVSDLPGLMLALIVIRLKQLEPP